MTVDMKWKSRIDDRTARIAIVGLGYVGFPLALRFADVGFNVVGIDINADHVDNLKKGWVPFNHISADALVKVRDRMEFTTDFASARSCDAVILCVPTPLNRYREPDLSYIVDSMNGVLPYLSAGKLLSLESTTWPGTTDEVLKPMLEKAGLTPGKDFSLVFSPEREDPGNKAFKLHEIPKVVGGSTPSCGDAGEILYGAIVDRVVRVSSTKAAELTKLLENIQRSVNIGLMNEMKSIAKPMGIDIFEVIAAASTKPFGFSPYFPGPGLGGHCIPIDPFYLTWKAREYGLHTRFIELSGEINASMPMFVVNGLTHELSEHKQLALKGARILVVGLAYKKNVNDIRESPALEIISLLSERQVKVSYLDPYVAEIPKTRHYGELHRIASISQNDIAKDQFDAAVIVTDHDIIDYKAIADAIPLIIDTRGAYRRHDPGQATVLNY